MTVGRQLQRCLLHLEPVSTLDRTAPAFVDLNFAPERIAKIVGKQGIALRAREEMKRHLA